MYNICLLLLCRPRWGRFLSWWVWFCFLPATYTLSPAIILLVLHLSPLLFFFFFFFFHFFFALYHSVLLYAGSAIHTSGRTLPQVISFMEVASALLCLLFSLPFILLHFIFVHICCLWSFPSYKPHPALSLLAHCKTLSHLGLGGLHSPYHLCIFLRAFMECPLHLFWRNALTFTHSRLLHSFFPFVFCTRSSSSLRSRRHGSSRGWYQRFARWLHVFTPSFPLSGLCTRLHLVGS